MLTQSLELIKNKVKVAEFQPVSTASQAKKQAHEYSFPCWLKLSSEKIIHKTEQKAVLKCKDEKQLEENFNSLKKLKQVAGGEIILQKSYEGIELIAAVKQDKIFGKIIMLGLGGLFTEVLKEVSFRSIPLEQKDILQMLSETKISQLMTARKKYPVDKLIHTLASISTLDNIEINPLIVTEQDVIAIDARIA